MGTGILKRRKRKKVSAHKRHKRLRHPKKTGRNANKRHRIALGLWSRG